MTATITANESVFAKYMAQAWPYTYQGTLHVPHIAGGIPFDENVATGWLKSKLGDKGDILRDEIANTMAARGITLEEATQEVDKLQHLNGFKRQRCERCPRGNSPFVCDGEHELYIEGRQLKAAIKEAVSVSVAAGKLEGKKWGMTNKGAHSFVAEHVMVMDERLYLGVTEPTEIIQRFVHTFRGSGIQYEEVVDDVTFDFTVMADWKLTDEQWAMIWLTGEQQGIGASRAQGFGRYKVVRWERVA